MKLFFLFILFIFVGCASTPRQTQELLRTPPMLPTSYEVSGVPFINQEAGQCGPATLAMVMQWAGYPIDVNHLVKEVYTPKMEGSLQADMISASRRHGFLAVPIHGFDSLLKEIVAGHPVIVFENLAFTWLPQWHYAVVYGYDIAKHEVIMHSGPEQGKRWDMKTFERSWMLGDYWGLVVLPPGQISASASELENSKAAAGLEQVGQLEAAEIAYKKIIEKWPHSLVSLIGLANFSYQKKNLKEALQYLTEASEEYPEISWVWHNLALVQGELKQEREARRSALRAMQLATAEEKPKYASNLKPWLNQSKN